MRLTQFLVGRPLERFLRIEAASGLLLMLAAVVALIWANSPWSATYVHFWHTPIGIHVGSFAFERSLEWVVNDGLMVVFFFVVGLEIRREIHQGELSEFKRAMLPAAAAVGGMLAPAALYLLWIDDAAIRPGWGVPMATDIAFAVGVLTLLGKRVPAALRVLLLALAVIDDLGAIMVIALFYSSGIHLFGLLAAALGVVGILALQATGVRTKLVYVLPALVVWAGVYDANIHPTIAGVLVGLLTPVRPMVGSQGLREGLRRTLSELPPAQSSGSDPHLVEAVHYVDVLRREALSPAESLIESLHPWVAFGIMPVFALANAGVAVDAKALDGASWQAAIAVAAGLLLGKPIGVIGACLLATRTGLGKLPVGLTIRHLLVLGAVAGIGFTMALFVAQLAFTDPGHLGAAKLGVLAGSGLAAVIGLVLGRLLLSETLTPGAASTADEAERSAEV